MGKDGNAKSTNVTPILFACQTRTNQISDFVQKLMFQKMSQPVIAALIAIRIFTNLMEILLMLWGHVYTHLFSLKINLSRSTLKIIVRGQHHRLQWSKQSLLKPRK